MIYYYLNVSFVLKPVRVSSTQLKKPEKQQQIGRVLTNRISGYLRDFI